MITIGLDGMTKVNPAVRHKRHEATPIAQVRLPRVSGVAPRHIPFLVTTLSQHGLQPLPQFRLRRYRNQRL